jgi:acyl-CoA synthetase (AMP-forming)/AMP-acid ligase II
MWRCGLHAPRVFLRWALDGAAPASLTYAAAGALVARVAATLFERDAALRGNLKRARPLCLVAANQSPMANIVLLGAALSGYTVAHASSSLPADTLSALVHLLQPSAIVRARDAALSAGLVFDAEPALTSDPQSLNSLIGRSTVTLDDITPDRLPSSSVAVVLFTSGSSGVPKAARFSETLALPAAVESTVQPCVRLDFAPFDPSHLLSMLSTLTVGGERVIGRSMSPTRRARP